MRRILLKTAFFAAALGLVTLIYWEHFDNGFHFDDAHTIVSNPYISSLKNIPDFFTKGAETFSSLPQNMMYRPLVTTTLAVDYALSKAFDPQSKGLNPYYYHLDSFFWFLVVIVMLVLFLHRLLKESDLLKLDCPPAFAFLIALWSGLFFALHTAIGETVNYIIARSDILSTAGILGGLLLYSSGGNARRYGIYLIPVVLGMLAKETTAMFYPILLSYIILFEKELGYPAFILNLFRTTPAGKDARMAIARSLPALVVVLIVGLFTMVGMRADTFTPSSYSGSTYAITQPWVIQHYFQSFLFPVHLSADSDWVPLPGMTDARFISGALFIALLLAVIVWSSNKSALRGLSFGLGFFILALLPTSSFVALAEVMNDHRMFLPFTGLTIALGTMVGIAINHIRKRASHRIYLIGLFAAAIVVIGLHARGTMKRIAVWHDEESLWADVVVKSPQNGRGLMNYGLTLMSKGQIDSALVYFVKALDFNPYYPYLHTNLGIAYSSKADHAKALEHFQLALQYGPDLHEVRYFYARYLLSLNGTNAEAEQHLKRSIELSPSYLPARHLLMRFYTNQGAWELVRKTATETLASFPADNESKQYLELAAGQKSQLDIINQRLAATPSPELYLEKSLMQYQLGDYSGCIESCRQALALKPDYAEAYNNICSAYNMLKEWDKAMQACSEALRLIPGYELARNNYLYAQGQKEAAR